MTMGEFGPPPKLKTRPSTTVHLTSEQLNAARLMGATPAEYAQGLLKMRALQAGTTANNVNPVWAAPYESAPLIVQTMAEPPFSLDELEQAQSTIEKIESGRDK